MAPVDARAFLILLASSGNQAATAAALSCSGAAVSRRLAEARKTLGDKEALALIEKHKRDDASGVNLRKPFIMGTAACGVCGGQRTLQPSGKLRCHHCRKAQYRAAHPVDPSVEVLSPDEVARRFIRALAQAGTQRAAAAVMSVSQPVVAERFKKARTVLGDEVVIELLKAHAKDEKSAHTLLKPFFLNSPECRQCGNLRVLDSSGGLTCRHCANLRTQEYRERHPGRIKEANAAYYVENSEALAVKRAGFYAANPTYNRNYYLANTEKVKALVSAYLAANRERISAWRKEYSKSPERVKKSRAAHAAWKKRNPHKVAEDNVRRAVAYWQQRPSWADKAVMRELYALARLRTALTGIQWVVDHIVPLHSDLVCGLHCEANLQVIPAATNAVKLNLWWPDMPDAPACAHTFAEKPSAYLVLPAGATPLLRAAYLPPALASSRAEPSTPPEPDMLDAETVADILDIALALDEAG